MTLDEYQKWTRTTAIYRTLSYPQLALAEETGEFLGKIAKYVRDVIDNDYVTEEQAAEAYAKVRKDLLKEGGDILWDLARCLDDFNISLQEALDNNVEKLESRRERNVINGSGDDR